MTLVEDLLDDLFDLRDRTFVARLPSCGVKSANIQSPEQEVVNWCIRRGEVLEICIDHVASIVCLLAGLHASSSVDGELDTKGWCQSTFLLQCPVDGLQQR